MKFLVPLAVVIAMPLLMSNSAKIPQTVSHLSETMQGSTNAIIQALQDNQASTFPSDNSDS